MPRGAWQWEPSWWLHYAQLAKSSKPAKSAKLTRSVGVSPYKLADLIFLPIKSRYPTKKGSHNWCGSIKITWIHFRSMAIKCIGRSVSFGYRNTPGPLHSPFEIIAASASKLTAGSTLRPVIKCLNKIILLKLQITRTWSNKNVRNE